MSRPDASEGDMAYFLRSLPGDRPHQGDGHLEGMLSGQPLPELPGQPQGIAPTAARERQVLLTIPAIGYIMSAVR